MCFLPCTVAHTDFSITKKVVVLMPPPVEPGEPPMNIKTMIIITEGNAIDLISNIIKPEVRHVAISKNAVKILSKRVSCTLNALSFSMKKKRTEQTMISPNVVMSTILVCGIKLFHGYFLRSRIYRALKKSRMVRNPMPPRKTNTIMMTCGK